jgi:outer membrane protein assembly factor BamB
VNWDFRWSFTGMALRTVASPIAHEGLVFLNSGDGGGPRDAIAVALGGQGDVSKSNLVWEDRKSFPYVPTLLASDGYLFGVTDKGSASCWDAKTGAEIWTERLGSPVTASPILVDGKIYVAAEDGKVFVIAAAPKFKLLATNSIEEPVSATPAEADNCLYIRGGEHLFCIGKPAKK